MNKMWIFFLLAFSACLPKNQKYGGDGGGKWPESWNADMEVTIGESGGMLPEWWEMTVHNDSAVYKYSYDQNSTIVRVKLSKEELDSIAHIINRVEPHKVRMKEHAVIYDKGSTYVRVRHKARVHTLSESATQSFTDNGWKQFYKIYSLVYNMVERKARATQVTIKVTVDCKSSSTNYWVHLQRNNRGSKIMGCTDTARTQTLTVYPGDHGFYAYVFQSEKGTYEYRQKTWPFHHMQLRITKDTVLNFQLKDSVLELKK